MKKNLNILSIIYFVFVQVFEAVVSWVNNNPINRRDYMPGLVEHVRLPLLSRDYLVQRVEDEPLIKSSSSCKDYLIEAMKYHLLPKEQRILIKNPRTRQRTPIGLPKVNILIIRQKINDCLVDPHHFVAGRVGQSEKLFFCLFLLLFCFVSFVYFV